MRLVRIEMVMVFHRLMAEQEDYPAAIAAIVGQLVRGNRAGAERDMAGIAYARRTISRRPAIPRPLVGDRYREGMALNNQRSRSIRCIEFMSRLWNGDRSDREIEQRNGLVLVRCLTIM